MHVEVLWVLQLGKTNYTTEGALFKDYNVKVNFLIGILDKKDIQVEIMC